jgi:hypothetical protein
VIGAAPIEGRRVSFGDVRAERYVAFVDGWTADFGFHTDAQGRTWTKQDQARSMAFNVVALAFAKKIEQGA